MAWGTGPARFRMGPAVHRRNVLKREWPDLASAAEHDRAGERQNGRILPAHMPGGTPEIPWGHRAALPRFDPLSHPTGRTSLGPSGELVSSGVHPLAQRSYVNLTSTERVACWARK